MKIGGNGIVIESWKEHSKSSLVTLVFARSKDNRKEKVGGLLRETLTFCIKNIAECWWWLEFGYTYESCDLSPI